MVFRYMRHSMPASAKRRGSANARNTRACTHKSGSMSASLRKRPNCCPVLSDAMGQQRTHAEIKSLLPLMHDFLSAAILSPPIALVAHASG